MSVTAAAAAALASNPPSFVVLDKFQIAKLPAGAEANTLDEAITKAQGKVLLDRQPRYIVQVMSLVEIDRDPRVLISPYPDPTAQPSHVRSIANL